MIGRTDRWLQGRTAEELTPNLFKIMSKNTVKKRTVVQALTNQRWASDIRGPLTVEVLVEYLHIWDLVDQ